MSDKKFTKEQIEDFNSVFKEYNAGLWEGLEKTDVASLEDIYSKLSDKIKEVSKTTKTK